MKIKNILLSSFILIMGMVPPVFAQSEVTEDVGIWLFIFCLWYGVPLLIGVVICIAILKIVVSIFS